MNLSFVHPQALYLFLLVPLLAALALLGRRRPNRTRFWVGLLLRLVVLTSIILALAGAQLRTPADTLTAVFMLDVSDSVPEAEQARGEALIREAIGAMPTGDRAAVVVFGQDALVERLAVEDRLLAGLSSVPLTVRTDIASALQLALALFPDEGAKRLILLSDGRENLGQAVSQAELAAAHGIELTYISLGQPDAETEVLIESLEAPAGVRLGQSFDLTAVVRSTTGGGATLRILADGRLIHSQEVRLQPGENRFFIPVEADETGFRRFEAQLMPDMDTRLQNNQASAFTVIEGPPRVLLVEGQPGEGDNLAAALREAEMEVAVVPPGELPTTLPELAAYESVILANVGADQLPPEAMPTLQVYVRELGKGLLMTGGETSFGAGGYLRSPLEEALPVDMDVRSKEQTPNLALVLVIDKSGSMGRCHCNNPDLDQIYTRQEVGQPKVDIAKEAIMRAAAALGPQDYMGVVAFDEVARWSLEVQPVLDVITLERSIGTIQAAGQTNMRSGVEAAYAALQGVEARFKHVILMTDGWIHAGELTALADEMKDQGITLSVVAAGSGSALYLSELATAGGGRYYPAEDILSVPDFFLKETITAVGEYIIEEPFYPLPSMSSPVLRGLETTMLPPLLGYNGTTPKSTARIALETPRGDPLLATWQYGLGRTAAWTSDLKGQWATDWVTWEDFARFATQLVGWTLPVPQVEGLDVQAELQDDQAVIRVDARDAEGQPRSFLEGKAVLIGPDLEPLETELAQVGAGQYEASTSLSQPGTYLVQVSIQDGEEMVGQQTLGLVVPYSPEYKETGANPGLLDELARITGGGELPEPVAAFLHDLPASDRAHELSRMLLLLAALLFPLDVAVRRVMLDRREWTRAVVWVRDRLPGRQLQIGRGPQVLGQLFAARDRARTRRDRAGAGEEAPTVIRQISPDAIRKVSPDMATQTPPGVGSQSPRSARAPSRPQPSADGEDTLARLHDAKRRARQK